MKKFLCFLMAIVVFSTVGVVGQGTANANKGDDTVKTAKIIKKAGSVKGVLNGRSDKDFYTYKAPANGLLSIKMSNAGVRKTVDVLDSDGKTVLAVLTTDDDNLGDARRSVGLKKGQKVFFKIHRNKSGNASYQLAVSFKNGNNYEKENNNTMRTANSIASTSKTTAELQTTSDKDYYKFTLKAAGNMHVKMSNAGKTKKIRVLNAKKEVLATLSTSDKKLGSVTRNIGLAKGTYYVELDTKSGSYIPYTLHLKYTKSNYFEKEVNNSLRSANAINLNKSYKGVLEASHDQDFFQFKVTKKKSTKLYLNNSGERKTLYLYNSKGKLLKSFATKPKLNKSSSVKVTLNKGTYSVKLGKYSGSNQAYTLLVK